MGSGKSLDLRIVLSRCYRAKLALTNLVERDKHEQVRPITFLLLAFPFQMLSTGLLPDGWVLLGNQVPSAVPSLLWDV